MRQLEPPDSHFLSAALGWLGLGMPDEAAAELRRLNPEYLDHPDVLELTWQILALKRNWEDALGVAHSLIQIDPHRANAWLHHAYALRRCRTGGLEAAREALLPAASAFPREPTIPYNLSCYAAQMGLLDEAREWFQEALNRGDKNTLKKMALADEDLKPLWAEIKTL